MTKVRGSNGRQADGMCVAAAFHNYFVINSICRGGGKSENYDQSAWQQRFVTVRNQLYL